MKKFLLIGLLAFAVVLTGCSEKLDKEDLFEKKQECASYKEEMGKEAKQYYSHNYRRISEIFYSPIRNSCLYVVYVSRADDTKNYTYPYEVHDFFTKEMLGLAEEPLLKELKGE